MKRKTVIALATTDAASAIAIARASDEAVTFITGNSHMPPLRAFGSAERVWQANDNGDLFTLYDEVFEKALEAANVYLGCPDYDNSLYVVDMNRWEHADNADDSETLSGEWTLRTDEAAVETAAILADPETMAAIAEAEAELGQEVAVTYTWVVTMLPGQSPGEAVEEYVHSVSWAFDSPAKVEPINPDNT